MDGGTGTVLQGLDLDEAAYRGERFADHPRPQTGNHDLDVGSAQQINNGYGFKFFAAVCKGDEHACHDWVFLRCSTKSETGTSSIPCSVSCGSCSAKTARVCG